jgi:hypothetical protein
MSYANGPKIVTNNLVLLLDAGNSKSYPGSGNTWFDLSGNNNNGAGIMSSAINGPTFSSSNGGSIVFAGSFDSVTIPNQTRNILSCNIWLKKTNANTTVNNRDRLVMSINSFGWGIGINGDNTVFFTNVGMSQTISNQVINNTLWNNLCITHSGSLTCFYFNGVLDVCKNYSASFSSSGNYSIGSRGNNEWFSGSMSHVSIYSSVLTAENVLQNYNALKGRFNL